MKARRAVASLAAAVSLCGVSAVAVASACNQQIVVPIKFSAGAYCWMHSGRGTTFTGVFRAGQKIDATAAGQESFMQNGRIVSQVAPWSWAVEGPAGFNASSPSSGNEALHFVTTRSGKYSLTVYPCAIWGAPGNVSICAH